MSFPTCYFLYHSCPKYSNLPTGCYETKKTGECCTSVQCDSGTILTSTNNLGTIGSGGLMVVKNPSQPQIIPTVPGGATPRPGTGGTGMKAPTLRMFVFSHNQHKLRKKKSFFKYSY